MYKILLPFLSLAACTSDSYDAVTRSDVVRVCPDGTLVGFDPETQRYTIASDGWTGFVAKGVTIENICKEATSG